EFLAFKELKAGTAAGGDVPEGGIVKTERADCGGGVAAADDSEAAVAAVCGQGCGHGTCAFGERGKLEHAHGPVPEDRLGPGDGRGKGGTGVGADVQAQAGRPKGAGF